MTPHRPYRRLLERHLRETRGTPAASRSARGARRPRPAQPRRSARRDVVGQVADAWPRRRSTSCAAAAARRSCSRTQGRVRHRGARDRHLRRARGARRGGRRHETAELAAATAPTRSACSPTCAADPAHAARRVGGPRRGRGTAPRSRSRATTTSTRARSSPAWASLGQDELATVLAYERANRNRRTIVERAKRSPPPSRGRATTRPTWPRSWPASTQAVAGSVRDYESRHRRARRDPRGGRRAQQLIIGAAEATSTGRPSARRPRAPGERAAGRIDHDHQTRGSPGGRPPAREPGGVHELHRAQVDADHGPPAARSSAVVQPRHGGHVDLAAHGQQRASLMRPRRTRTARPA